MTSAETCSSGRRATSTRTRDGREAKCPSKKEGKDPFSGSLRVLRGGSALGPELYTLTSDAQADDREGRRAGRVPDRPRPRTRGKDFVYSVAGRQPARCVARVDRHRAPRREDGTRRARDRGSVPVLRPPVRRLGLAAPGADPRVVHGRHRPQHVRVHRPVAHQDAAARAEEAPDARLVQLAGRLHEPRDPEGQLLGPLGHRAHPRQGEDLDLRRRRSPVRREPRQRSTSSRT